MREKPIASTNPKNHATLEMLISGLKKIERNGGKIKGKICREFRKLNFNGGFLYQNVYSVLIRRFSEYTSNENGRYLKIDESLTSFTPEKASGIITIIGGNLKNPSRKELRKRVEHTEDICIIKYELPSPKIEGLSQEEAQTLTRKQQSYQGYNLE